MTGTDQKSDRNGGDETASARPGPDAEAVAAAAAAIDAEALVEAAAMAERLAAAEAEAARLKDEYLRALAETENVRRRAARDRQEAGQYAITAFARDLLSVADNLQRALASVDAAARAADPALAALTDGVAMTEKELLTVFERYGVKPIAADGQPFDPHVHEALYEVPNPEVPHGTVLQVAQTGYMLHDRTLRPARVGIAKGGPKTAAASAEDGAVVDFPQRNAGEAYRKRSESDTDQGAQVDRKT
ncbi:MAG: nucleotide exchange factor GrpE [Rhodospirillales bacterium]|nr:nucleotide exchange factor GrpE [Rhodospirillales bacterium]